MSGVIAAACCCEPAKTTPCDGIGLTGCPAVALVVEGTVVVGYDSTNTYTYSASSQCGDCGDGGSDGPVIGGDNSIGQNPSGGRPPIQGLGGGGGLPGSNYTVTTSRDWEVKGNMFVTVQFKALLLRGSGQAYGSSPTYPTRTSVSGDLEFQSKDIDRYQADACSNNDSQTINKNAQIEINKAQDDPFIDGLIVTRNAKYWSCTDPFSSDVDCVMIEYGEGCYETFSVAGTVTVPSDVTIDYEYYSAFTANNSETIVADLFANGENYAEQQLSVSMTTWARVENPANACPLPGPRPPIASTYPPFSTSQKGCQDCLPNPCECFAAYRSDYPRGVKETASGGAYTQLMNVPSVLDNEGNPQVGANTEMVFPLNRCQGMGFPAGNGTIDASDQAIWSCDQEIESCIFMDSNQAGHMCWGDFCGPPSTGYAGLKHNMEEMKYEGSTYHNLTITRATPLSSLPDPDIWPNV